MNVVPLKVTEKFYRSIVKSAKICGLSVGR